MALARALWGCVRVHGIDRMPLCRVRLSPNRAGNKENVKGDPGTAGEGGGTLKAPKSAAHMNQLLLINMKKENDSARSFLREVSAGRAGNDGPYFSPCRAKGSGDEKSIKDHPLSVAPPVVAHIDSSPLLRMRLLRWHLPLLMPASSSCRSPPLCNTGTGPT